MNANIPATGLGRELASVLSRVRRQGESVLVEQDGEAVATLEPVGASRGATWRTLTQALHDRSIGNIDVAADLEDVQRNQPEIPTNVWPSESTPASSSHPSGSLVDRSTRHRPGHHNLARMHVRRPRMNSTTCAHGRSKADADSSTHFSPSMIIDYPASWKVRRCDHTILGGRIVERTQRGG